MLRNQRFSTLMFTQISQIPNTSLCNTCIVFIIIYFKYLELIVCKLLLFVREIEGCDIAHEGESNQTGHIQVFI